MTKFAKILPASRRLRILRKAPERIQPGSPRPQRRDCQGQLLAALEARAGGACIVADASMRPWCSATFVGAQHRITLRFESADAADREAVFTDGLGEAEFKLCGHIVADATVEDVRSDGAESVAVSLAFLTIEDW